MRRRSLLSTLRVFSFLCAVTVLGPVCGLAQTLNVVPEELLFTATIGGANPPSQTVQVSSDTPGRAFQVQKNPFVSAAWLTFTPTAGATPGTVTFSVDASNFFSAGSQTVDVTISLPGTGLAKKVEVTVVVSGVAMQPVIDVTPNSMAFSVASGAGSPPPQQLRVVNTGGGFLNYQIAVNYPAGAPSGWLSASPASGSAPGGPNAPQIAHAISVNPAGLGPGQYSATLRVSGNAQNFETVLVTLTVAPEPSLLVDPVALSFSASEGGTNPPAQNITISSTQGGAIAYQITSDQTWLTVEPAQGTTAAGSQVHAVSANITGLGQGNYTANLTLTPASGDPTNLAVSLSIATPSAILTIPTRIDFSGSTRVPIRERRLLSIVSNPLASGRWTARVVPLSATWLKVSPGSGGIPGNLLVEVDNRDLGAATLEAHIEITHVMPAGLTEKGGGPVAQAPGTALVPVSLTLVNQEGALAASPVLLDFSALEGAVTPLAQILYVESRGGPALEWQAEVSTDDASGWLSATAQSGVAPTRLVVTADPVGLDAGVHHGRIRLIAGGQRVDVPVSFLVQAPVGVLATGQTSLYFEVQAGTATVLEKTIRVLNRGSGALNWSTHIVEQSGTAQWLSVTPSSGVSEGGSDSPPLITFTVRPEVLNAGVQSALVEIASTGSGQSRFVTVAVNVTPQGGAVAPALEPSGLAFSATATGVTPAPQQVRLRSNQSGALGFLSGASTFSGGGWLQVQPANGNAAAGGATLEVSANHAGLAPGTYHGLVGITFGDGTVRSAPVILTVRPAGAGCVPASASLSPVSPMQNFVAATARAIRLEAAVVDDCGNGVAGVAVLAAFSNGDPALPLRDLGGGRYGATWAARNAASQVNIRYEMVSGASAAESTLVGTVVSTAAARLSQQASVNGASFARGEALAPGGIITTFGFNLAPASTQASTLPLPLSLAGVRLFVAGRQAPLFYADFGQINAQVPFETAAGRRADVIASVNGQFTVPQEIVVGAARPGIFALPTAAGPPRAVAQNQDFSLNGPANPAALGEAIVVYLTGAGEVDPQVPTGGGAPAEEPFARATLRATATIGGSEAEILFLGLTPGFVGLAQANMIVPLNSTLGPNVPVIISIDGQPSNVMVIAVEP